MANHTRNAKYGNDWTENELRAYNIQVVEQSFEEFFNLDKLPPVPPALRHFCELTDRALSLDDDTHKLLHYLDLALIPTMGQEAVVDNFAARLLETLGYASGRRIIVTHQALPFTNCGMQRSALTDVCIRSENDYLFLLQREKGVEFLIDPEPQLIAAAIAAYQRNNFVRNRVLHVPICHEIIFPGITLVGTSPIFYKIKVTSELEHAVMGGIFPDNPVVVYRHIPKLPCRSTEGMDPLENRATIIQYYQAFKAFI